MFCMDNLVHVFTSASHWCCYDLLVWNRSLTLWNIGVAWLCLAGKRWFWSCSTLNPQSVSILHTRSQLQILFDSSYLKQTVNILILNRRSCPHCGPEDELFDQANIHSDSFDPSPTFWPVDSLVSKLPRLGRVRQAPDKFLISMLSWIF